jgi:hypothetical protein
VILADEIKHVHDHDLLELIRAVHSESRRIPPGRVEAEQAAAAAVGGEPTKARLFPGAPADFSAVSLPASASSEHQVEQEDYLWGV